MSINSGQKMLACLVCSVAFGSASDSAFADTRENSYTIIPQRNAFALKEIPPPVPPNTNPPAPPPAQVKLSGITTILSRALALLEYTEPGKQVQKPILSAGQRDGPIEILEIDARAGTVKIRNGGVETLLTFEKDGIKPPSGPAGPVPGAPGVAAAAHPVPGFSPPLPAGAAYNPVKPGTPAYPTTRLNAGAVPSGGIPPPGAVAPSIQFNNAGGLQTIPIRPTRLPQGGLGSISPEIPIGREDQIVQIEVKREIAKQAEAAGQNSTAPSFLYPPTPVTPQ